MLGVGVFLLSGYDTCIALLFSLRDSLLFTLIGRPCRDISQIQNQKNYSIFKTQSSEEKAISYTQAIDVTVLQPCFPLDSPILSMTPDSVIAAGAGICKAAISTS
jgi:hypothetical protein